MAFCINCGEKLIDGSKFCHSCGSPVSIEPEAKRKVVYEGNLHKCPNCGELVNSFVLNCPLCGFEFRNSKSTSSVQKLTSQLEDIEHHREPRKPRTFKDEFLGRNNLSKEDEQKINLIRSFIIPNTKEDILEFMILASSNINSELYSQNNLSADDQVLKASSDAWLAKFEQAYQKALFSFPDSSIFSKIQQIYTKKIKEVNKQKRKKELALPLAFAMMFIPIGLGLVALLIMR